jgi:HEAT repeat protein
MSQENPARIGMKNSPVLPASRTDRTGIPVFVSVPPQPQAAPVVPAPAVASQGAASRARELIQALQNSSADMACEAAIALGKLGDLAAVAPLIEVVENFSGYFHGVVRAAACDSLGQLGDRSAMPALLKAINNPMAEASVEAVRALAAIGDERAIEPLTAVSRNADYFFAPDVRLAAVDALRQFNSSQPAAALNAARADINEDPVLRAAAAPARNLTQITDDSIAEVAYEIWERNGRPEGQASQQWLQAEAQLRAERCAVEQSH